jgi:hypothetical protein
MSALGNGTIPLSGGCSEFLLAVFLRGDYYLVIGLEVLLLIKIHCEYIFIMKGLLMFAYFLFVIQLWLKIHISFSEPLVYFFLLFSF